MKCVDGWIGRDGMFIQIDCYGRYIQYSAKCIALAAIYIVEGVA